MRHVPQRRTAAGFTTGALSLGSWHTYDRMPFEETVQVLRTAVDAGITLFDVGVYGWPGQSPVFTDVIFSAAVRAAGLKRSDYQLSGKLWLEGYPEQSLREQLERALVRAGTETADLVVLGDLRREVDLERLVGDLGELHRDGLISAWGVNNWSAGAVCELLDIAERDGLPGPVLAQLKYSVARRSIPDGEPFAEAFARGVGLQASDVLEGGVLLGKTGREVGRDPGGVRDRIAAAAPRLKAIAAALDATPAQLGLAFTLTHPATVTTLVGVSSLAQLAENVGALDLLDRIGAERLRGLVADLWADRDAVDPEGP